jgi:ABC-type glycerol-3-phosphate transport system substrate-binding protein
MKSIITTLLCALVTLCTLTGALADSSSATLFSSEQKTAIGLTNDYCNTMATVGETVYTQWSMAVYSWKPGQETPEKVASDVTSDYYNSNEDAVADLGEEKASKIISKFISDGTTLYGLNRHTGYIYPLTFAEGATVYGTPIQLEWEGLDNSQGSDAYVEISRLVISGDYIYLMARRDTDYNNPELYCFEKATGKRKVFALEYMQDIASYKDGKVLALILNYDTAYPSDGSDPIMPSYAVVDPADGSVTQLGSFDSINTFGLVYRQDTDTLYYCADNKLMALPGLANPAQVGYMPADSMNNADVGLLSSGAYVLNTWNALLVRSTDPNELPTATLSVYNGYMDDTVTSFLAKNPQTAVTFNQNVYYSTTEELAQAMASADSSFDVYNVNLSYDDFSQLMDKGYCLDLSASPTLVEKLAKLYPFVQAGIQKDGLYYAVPTQVYAYGLSTTPNVWEDAGLKDRVPTSFMGLIDFFDWWVNEGADEHPDLQLMGDVTDFREKLFNLALDLYVSNAEAEGQELTLDTPVFRAMLTALDDLDTDALNETLPASSEVSKDGRVYSDSGETLFIDYGDWMSLYNDDEYQKPLILSLEEGGAQHIPVYVSAMFINPNSANKDIALQYLENALDSMSRDQHIMLFPDDNEPVRTANYDTMITEWEDGLDKAKKQLETAKPEETKDIQATIDSYESLLKDKDKYIWDVSAEDIENYRASDSLYFTAVPNLLGSNGRDETSEISTLIDRYVQRQISLDQFIKEADQKIRMILMERQ